MNNNNFNFIEKLLDKAVFFLSSLVLKDKVDLAFFPFFTFLKSSFY